MDWLKGINDEMLEKAEEEQKQYEVDELPAGVHAVEIEKAYLRTTDGGATMLEVDFKNNDGRLHWSTAIKSGNEKGNKATYTDRKGNEKPLPGVVQLNQMLKAIGLKMKDINPTKGRVKHFGTEIDAGIFKQLTGKKLKIGVQYKENEYNGNVTEQPEIIKFMDLDGKDGGEYVEDKISTRIAKKPLVQIKRKETKTSNNDDASAVSSWN